MPSPSSPRGSVWLSPWLWSGAGLLGCALAAACQILAADAGEPLRLGLIVAALLAAGFGLSLQFMTSEPIRSSNAAPALILILVYAGLTLGVTGNLLASSVGTYWFDLRPGLSLLFWLLIGPMSAVATWQTIQRRSAGAPLERGELISFNMLLASATAFLACFALDNGELEFSESWYTVQRFLRMIGIAALVATPLTVVDGTTRRIVASGLAVFHLGGILVASMSHPPAPWIVTQTYARIYRPYLQFMYLTNAYHFYSPEPGPASHVWFYLYYTNPQGERLGHWYKIPSLNDQGEHGHFTSLEYQRHLSITEHTMPTDGLPIDSAAYQKIAALRLAWTPEGAKKDPIVGLNPTKHEVLVPLNPTKFQSAQFHRTQRHVKRYLSSYSRHVLAKFKAKHPDHNYESVRVYRVVHLILPTYKFFIGMHPTDPELYMPVYMGEFDGAGKLLDPDSPFLYWEMPILRDNPRDMHSTIKDWARNHAGDPYWIRVGKEADVRWVDEKGQAAPN